MFEYIDICRNCMELICLDCSGKPCTPLEKTLDRMESEYYRSQQFRKQF